MLTTLVSFIVLLLVLIFVHELGHFLAAKLLGVKVEKFSLGFPPKLWSKKIGETEYQLAWLPLGGYVSLLGENPGVEIPPEDQARCFSAKPLWVRAIVVAAGPLFNIIFAVFALWVVNFSAGVQYVLPEVGPVAEESPAQKAGLKTDDMIFLINSHPITSFSEIQEIVDISANAFPGKPITLTVHRPNGEKGEVINLQVTPEKSEWTDLLGDAQKGWTIGVKPRTKPIIDEAIAGKPAQEGGVLPGDIIVSIDGVLTPDWTDVMSVIKGTDVTEEVDGKIVHQKPKPLKVVIDRNGQEVILSLTPVLDPVIQPDGKTGFTPILGLKPRMSIMRRPLSLKDSFFAGVEETWAVSVLTVKTFIRLFQTKISVKVLGGPLMIAEVAGKKAREGLVDFIWVMALISVNLAIINLVPLPILDGGQLLFFLIEAIRRRPLSLRFREACQWVGVTAMVALMILVFYNDIHRWVTRFSGPAVSQVEVVE